MSLILLSRKKGDISFFLLLPGKALPGYTWCQDGEDEAVLFVIKSDDANDGDKN